MRKLLAGVTLAALMTGSAMAADLTVKAPTYKAPPPVVVYNWTGCYIGVNGGGAWQRRDNSLLIANDPGNGFFNPLAIPGVSTSGSGSLNSNGFTGGAQLGCNYQSAKVVWGVETDFNSLGQGSAFGGRFLYTTSGTPYFLNVSEDKNWLYTLRGRVGLAADRVLFYVTGGLAVAKYRFTQSFNDFDTEFASVSKTKAGWTVGAGVEAAVFDNWTVKGEYLFAQFSGDTVVGRVVTTGGGDATFTNSLGNIDLHVVRVGLNYKFGPAVVAKY